VKIGMVYQRGRIWWIKYHRNGQAMRETSGSDRKGDAESLLKLRVGDIERGLPVSAKLSQLRFDEAASDLETEYRINQKRSLDELERRIRKHLRPYFGGRRLANVTTADVRAFVAKRQGDVIVTGRGPQRRERSVSAGEINRELTTLKRIFNLARQNGKLLHVPHVPLLKERNTRTGFFEPEQFGDLLRHLPPALRPVATFAYITGWRIPSEVLPLQWRHVDLAGGTIRLDPHTTKNDDGRVFPMTAQLRSLLEGQKALADRLQKDHGIICPWVFHRSGKKHSLKGRRIRSFGKAWNAACLAAGCPGRIPHDLRRTAVRNLVRATIPERVAMQMTGHKTRSVFERYNIVSGTDLSDAAVKLDSLRILSDAL
jgi:integrase